MDEAKPLLALDEDGRERARAIIESAKKSLGKTNEDLARLLHCSRQTFGKKLENASFTESELTELCIELGIEKEYLLGRAAENHFAEYESPEFVARLYGAMNPRQKAAITTVMCSMVGSDTYMALKQDELRERVNMDILRIQRKNRYSKE